MLRTLCLVIISVAGFLFTVDGQTVNETYSFGLAQYENGNYDQAIDAFRRTAYFSEKDFISQPYLKLGDCYLETNNYLKAQSYYDLSYLNTVSDSLKNEIIFRKSACYLLDEKPDDALYVLGLGNFQTDLKRKNLYAGIAWYKKAQFDSSRFYFEQLTGPVLKDDINELFLRLKKINKLSPKKARRLSIFLPGLGQFYTKDYKNGANSFLLNVALLSLGGVVYVHYTWFDTLLFVGPWWRRYYVGGYKKAEINAGTRRNQERTSLLKEILKTCQSF